MYSFSTIKESQSLAITTLNYLKFVGNKHLSVEGIIRNSTGADWITLVIVLCMVLLAVAKLINSSRFDEFMLLVITNKYFLVQGKNKKIISPFNVLLFLVQILSVSLFIYLLFITFNPDILLGNPLLFLQIASAYFLFIALKYCVEKIIANIFSIDSYIDTYLYHKLSYRNLIAIFLLVINILLIYTIPINRALLITIVIITIIINAIALLYSYKSNEKFIMKHFFYFILYLCALEISPYYLLYKAVV